MNDFFIFIFFNDAGETHTGEEFHIKHCDTLPSLFLYACEDLPARNALFYGELFILEVTSFKLETNTFLMNHVTCC